MNNYLNICPIELIKKEGEKYSGMIKPMNYSSWATHDPLALLIEGIHQFSVRISVIAFPDSHTKSGSRIPGQLKQVAINEQPTYLEHPITGTCAKINGIYHITFKVMNLNSIEIISGQVYVATVDPFEKN